MKCPAAIQMPSCKCTKAQLQMYKDAFPSSPASLNATPGPNQLFRVVFPTNSRIADSLVRLGAASPDTKQDRLKSSRIY